MRSVCGLQRPGMCRGMPNRRGYPHTAHNILWFNRRDFTTSRPLDEEQKADGIDNQVSDTATASTTYLESAEINGEMVLADYFAGYLRRHLYLVPECGQDATLCRAIQ